MAECGKCGNERNAMSMASCVECHRLYCNDCANACKKCLLMACPNCHDTAKCRFSDCDGDLATMSSMDMF